MMKIDDSGGSETLTALSRFFTDWRKALFIVLLAYSFLHLASSIVRHNPWSKPEVSGDFQRTYTEAADYKMTWQKTGELPVVKGFRVYHGLPAYLLLFPFVDHEFAVVDHFFYLIQFLLFPLAFFLLLAAICPNSRPTLIEAGLAALLVFNFKPFLETLALHKMEGIEFFLVGLALGAFKKKRDYLTGAILLAAASLKYLPGILLVYFLLKRETKVILGALATGAAFVVVLFSVFGPSSMEALFRHPLDLLLRVDLESSLHAANIEWQTVSGVWFRILFFLSPSMKCFLLHFVGKNKILNHTPLTVCHSMFAA